MHVAGGGKETFFSGPELKMV